VTHEWAYRDLTHFQAMAKMRATDPEIRQLSHSPDDVPILEATQTSVLVPLPYHPAGKPPPSGSAGAMIATRRVVREQGADGAQYNRLAADYAQLAAGHGAELAGAYQTFFGWTPAHSLEVWRYPSLDAYFSIERAIASDPQGRKLLTAMRQIWPHEAIALNQPLPYSRLG
jgi:hypothetical protein